MRTGKSIPTQSPAWEGCIPPGGRQIRVAQAAYLKAKDRTKMAISPILPGASFPPRRGHLPSHGSSGAQYLSLGQHHNPIRA